VAPAPAPVPTPKPPKPKASKYGKPKGRKAGARPRKGGKRRK
jgi:hypothetical protein